MNDYYVYESGEARVTRRIRTRIYPLPANTTVWLAFTHPEPSCELASALFIAFRIVDYDIPAESEERWRDQKETGQKTLGVLRRRPVFPDWVGLGDENSDIDLDYSATLLFVQCDWECRWFHLWKEVFWTQKAAQAAQKAANAKAANS